MGMGVTRDNESLAVGGAEDSLADRISKVEHENSNLLNLYIALSQLHSSLVVADVLEVIVEVLLNFVGAEDFAILVLDGDGTLRPLATHGIDAASVPVFEKGKGVIGGTVTSGQVYCERFVSDERRDVRTQPPIVCVPLSAAGHPIGALPIWGFLGQKEGFDDIDHEIFQLMATSAGTALEAARLAMTTSTSRPAAGYYRAFAELIGQNGPLDPNG